jgi:hypothetical protein
MNVEQQESIRAYLTFLDDPFSLIDAKKINEIETAVAAAQDPIEKLKLLSDLERAKSVDGTILKSAFVTHAKPWATENGVTAEAFRTMGVSTEVLVAAGFTGLRNSKTRKNSPGKSTRATVRAPGVKSDGIQSSVLAKRTVFTIKEITTETGSTTATVTKVINALLDIGKVKEVGPLTNPGARGRAPMQYATK